MQHPKEGHGGTSQEVKHLEEWNSVYDLQKFRNYSTSYNKLRKQKHSQRIFLLDL